jgi:hypothetical protein
LSYGAAHSEEVTSLAYITFSFTVAREHKETLPLLLTPAFYYLKMFKGFTVRFNLNSPDIVEYFCKL